MRLITIIFIAAFLQACAFTDASIDVAHNPETNTIGSLSEVEKVNFQTAVFADNRKDKERIGYKKNGFGQNTADITTKDDVTNIVRSAVNDAITDNNHTTSSNGDIKIVGTVDNFWLDTDINFATVEFIGDIQCTIDFIETDTNKSIYKSTYTGNHREKVLGGYIKTWEKVMNLTLDKLLEDVVNDEDLVEVLENR